MEYSRHWKVDRAPMNIKFDEKLFGFGGKRAKVFSVLLIFIINNA